MLEDAYGSQILLGMGTLTTIQHVEQAVEAGARFIVSPHCEERLAQAMIATDLVTMIGAFTPSEIMKAHRLGSDIVKLYPGSLGTPAYLKSLHAPFPDIPIMPTGGVSVDNVKEWFDAGAFAVGAGSSLCPSAWALEGRFEEITKRAKAFVKEVEKAR
jgi:2-dehydro-3-deoxyphosphogluconate aldolase/(4S)-4-hydroxy-2-oxoglutarate aldolase